MLVKSQIIPDKIVKICPAKHMYESSAQTT